MFSKFMGAFGKQKLSEAKVSITEALVKFDPESATQAQLAIYEENLDKMALQTAELRQMANKENKEADEAKSSFNRYLAAKANIEEQIADESLSASKRKGLTKSLEELSNKLIELKPEVVREIEEAKEADEELAEMEDFLKERADQLKGAKKKLDAAQRGMRTAERDKERAAAKEARAKSRAGIGGSGGDSMDVALNAMNEVAQKSQAQADASRTKADLLHTPSLTEDSNIASALNAVDGIDDSKSSAEKVADFEAF